jgi:hypothetical protein
MSGDRVPLGKRRAGGDMDPGLRRDDMVGSETRDEHDWVTGSQAGTHFGHGHRPEPVLGPAEAGPVGRCDEKG